MTTPAQRFGRPREFDENVVVRAATEQFWERGYHATSLTDLTSATGLHRGSLYGAFGDKHQMLLTALTMYSDDSLAKMDRELGSDSSPMAGIRTYLRAQADQAAAGRGCLIANTALELLPGDQSVAVTVAAYQQAVEDRLTMALRRARASGELSGGQSARSIARLLLAVTKGLWEIGRTAREVQPLREIVDTTMRAIRERR
jgi:TetR/AcrR family transcriptional repressor of nem operon